MKAYELLSDPGKWTQGAGARSGNGGVVLGSDVTAVCWCVIGAIGKCYPSNAESLAAMHKVWLELNKNGFDGIANWNDDPGRTYEEVVEVLRKADV